MSSDPVDRLVQTWETERPDLDVAAMATFARIHRVSAVVRRAVDGYLGDMGFGTGEFDVLSALRRQGKPYQMKPSALARTVMLSPSGMTNRIDRLEDAGLVARVRDPDNRRIAPVRLTKTGKAAIDGLIEAHTANQRALLAPLTKAERRQLDALLRRLPGAIDPD